MPGKQKKLRDRVMRRNRAIFCLTVVLVISFVGVSYSQESSTIKLKQAEAIHERIRIHFKNKNYQQVASEMNDLFRLRLQGRDEDRVAQTLTAVVANLIRVRQYRIAHQVTDASLAYFTKPNTRATAWIQKGRVFEAEGKNELALGAFKRAEEEVKPR